MGWKRKVVLGCIVTGGPNQSPGRVVEHPRYRLRLNAYQDQIIRTTRGIVRTKDKWRKEKEERN